MEDEKIKRLVKKARQGDRQAFESLFLMEREYLYKTAFLYMKNQEDALDLVQECVMRCVVSIESLQKPEYFRTWMTRILIRCAMDEWRRRKKYQYVAETEVYEEVDTGEKTLSREDKMDLYHAIDQLEFPYKAIIIQRYFFDYKLKEISEMLDMPLGTIKAYHSKAKQLLKELLMEGTR
ncbi:MAG: sigma-70 family RNA polymerase sigma factor [Lachnospiraceae bacterium]|nr:sigma-70 family RNA polymerase sigma factor [Lachnospiraceae bacterium]